MKCLTNTQIRKKTWLINYVSYNTSIEVYVCTSWACMCGHGCVYYTKPWSTNFYVIRIKIMYPIFCVLFYVSQLKYIMCPIFFPILNFSYFIRKWKIICDELWLIKHIVKHKKWNKCLYSCYSYSILTYAPSNFKWSVTNQSIDWMRMHMSKIDQQPLKRLVDVPLM